MVSTVFSDTIVKATDLRTNQKHWLEKAYDKPITVSYGSKQLAIMNRDQVSKLYTTTYYLELVLKICDEFEKNKKITTIPWAEYLSHEDQLKLHMDLLTTALRCTITSKWEQLEYVIQDWQATAEVESNPELAKALLEKDDPAEYVKLKE